MTEAEPDSLTFNLRFLRRYAAVMIDDNITSDDHLPLESQVTKNLLMDKTFKIAKHLNLTESDLTKLILKGIQSPLKESPK